MKLRIPALLTFAFLASASYAVLTVQVIGVRNTACGNAAGQIEVSAFGGAPPYAYNWTPAPPTGNGLSAAAGLTAGTYQVEVTDDLGAMTSIMVTVYDDPFVTAVASLSMSWPACPGECNGGLMFWAVNGTMPYNWSSIPVETMGPNLAVFADGWCDNEQATIFFTDAGGCPGSAGLIMHSPQVMPLAATNIVGACGGNNGSFILHTNGDLNSLFGCYISVTNPLGVPIVNSSITGTGVNIPLTGLMPGTYTATRGWSSNNNCVVETLLVVVPDLGAFCGTINGHVFFDHDQDCAQDANDEGIPYRVLSISPGTQYAITSGDGAYTTNLAPGNYSLSQNLGNELISVCPGIDPIPFTIINGGNTVLELADSSLIALDIASWMAAGPARPGFAHAVGINVRNLSGQLSGMVDATLAFDPQFNFVSATPAPSSVVGNTITWNGLAAPAAFASIPIQVHLLLPPNPGLIGSPFVHAFTASQSITESSLVNNSASFSGTITGSYDPNDKVARTSSGLSDELYFIDQDQWIDYTIRFQNTGTDTAFTVVVSDTLATGLDLASFQQGAASHAFDIRFLPNRVVEWRFADIQLPDSGTNEPRSHGMINFRIRPMLPLPPGTMIENTANIYFDFNPPVITEPCVLVAEFSTGVGMLSDPGLLVFPNPARDRLEVRMVDGVRLALLDLSGREVLVGPLRSGQASLLLDEVPVGSYLLRVTNVEGRSFTRPVMKH